MRQEIVDFYAENRIPVDKLVAAGRRRGFEEKKVLKSAEEVFSRVQAGEKIDTIRLAWEVFRKSGPPRDRTWPAEKALLSEIRELRELVIGQRAEKEKVVLTVQDSVGQLNKVLDDKFSAIPKVDNRDDIASLQAAVEKLNRDLVELNTPWYKKALRWFNGN